MRIWVNYLKPGLGYLWMITALLASVAGLANLGAIEEVLFIKRGFQVTENWGGGRTDSVIIHDKYRTVIHQPVFAGLWSETDRGFIKIDWIGEPELPVRIAEAVDYDHDNRTDFIIKLNTVDNEVEFQSNQGRNLRPADEKVLVFNKSRSLRINIRRGR